MCDAATPIVGDLNRPSDGSLSMCIACGNIAVFTHNATALREPTPAEYRSILRDDAVNRARAALIEMHEVDGLP